MHLRFISSMGAALVLMWTAAASAQGDPQAPSPTSAQVSDDQDAPITLFGCVQRESDYRRAADAGRGGAVGTGAGLGNEFVLVNAKREQATTRPDCSVTSTTDAYELTGSGEGDLAALVGQYAEVTGTLKKMERSVDTTTGGRTAGVDPMGQDLRLPEVNVASSREVRTTETAAAIPPPVTQPTMPPEEPAPAPAQPVEPAPRTELPATASVIPLIGLVGLLSLSGAMVLRSSRRRSI